MISGSSRHFRHNLQVTSLASRQILLEQFAEVPVEIS